MGVLLGVVLVSTILLGVAGLYWLLASRHSPAAPVIRRTHHLLVVRRAASDLDREYQDLLAKR